MNMFMPRHNRIPAGNADFSNLLSVVLLFGFFVIALWSIDCDYPEAGVRSKVSRVRSDLRSIATALEAYYIDNNAYPCWAKGTEGANGFAAPQSGAFKIHTFRVWKSVSEQKTFGHLTTPVAYISYYYPDPFADTKGATYGYYADANGWILYSWGPDHDENNPESWNVEQDVEKLYQSKVLQPSFTLVAGSSSAAAHEAYTYDPSNGTLSPGDIWRVKQ